MITKRGNSWWVVVYAGRAPHRSLPSHGRHLGETGARPFASKPVAWWLVVAGTDGRRYGSWRAGVSCVRANPNPGSPDDPVYADRTA